MIASGQYFGANAEVADRISPVVYQPNLELLATLGQELQRADTAP
jgi:hypothetical protein